MLCLAVLSGCAVGPNYRRPDVITPAAFKEIPGQAPAVPADAVERGNWWEVFNDPTLNELEEKVEISNQNLQAAEAAHRQALAIEAENRAGLFPSLDLNGAGTRTHRTASGISLPGSGAVAPNISTGNAYQLDLGASWAPDLWGKIRRGLENATALAQASEADLANATLSAQSDLASNYIQLRLADADKQLLQNTVDAYAKSLQITRNQYTVGLAAKGDVLEALTQLTNTQASLVDLGRQRTAAEHAIAVLIGAAAADLSIAPIEAWTPQSPSTPANLPSTMLQRRPDIAGAERRAAAASAEIGVQMAGYFPDLALSGADGFASAALGALLKRSGVAWFYGGSVAQTVFDAGATSARVRAARAAFEQTVAAYREIVLGAFQQVEDGLAADHVLDDETGFRQQAAATADEAEQIALNEYRAGQTAYTAVVVAQTTALAARQSLLTVQGLRMTNVVNLMEALGGGWSGAAQ
jgi:NodT family efflux transporter outer membrane factor (OMF) lipoprotein